jgi:hypothetical protein
LGLLVEYPNKPIVKTNSMITGDSNTQFNKYSPFINLSYLHYLIRLHNNTDISSLDLSIL